MPNVVNTNWSEWYYTNVCQSNDLRPQERNLTEYDENNCYLITGLESDIFDDINYFEIQDEVCDFCTPIVQNTEWSSWNNISCLEDDLMNQSRFRIIYDSNFCGEVENSSEVEYQTIESCIYRTITIVNNTENLEIINNESSNETSVKVNESISPEKEIDLDLSFYLNNETVNLSSKLVLIRETNESNYTVEIPTGTSIAGSNWTGYLSLPTVNTNFSFTLGNVVNSIKVGANERLNLTKAAKIILSGVSDGLPFWSDGNSEHIISACVDANSSSAGNLTSDECYVRDGNDIIIWTYHFTIFGAYTSVVPSSPAISSDGSSGGIYSGSSFCSSQWKCSNWSECVNGTQTRTCSLPSTYCKPLAVKPNEEQTCAVIEIVEEEEIKPDTTSESANQKNTFQSLITGFAINFVKTFRNPISALFVLPVLVFILSLVIIVFIMKRRKIRRKKKAENTKEKIDKKKLG